MSLRGGFGSLCLKISTPLAPCFFKQCSRDGMNTFLQGMRFSLKRKRLGTKGLSIPPSHFLNQRFQIWGSFPDKRGHLGKEGGLRTSRIAGTAPKGRRQICHGMANMFFK